MRVGRPWRQRTEDLFACEVDYAGKSVLDAGSNVGILAYEISKRGPAFLHLIDGSEPPLDAARLIFNAVETPHRLDLVDLTDAEQLEAVLAPTYDIVQLLAVYQHIHRASGRRAGSSIWCSAVEFGFVTIQAIPNLDGLRKVEPSICLPSLQRLGVYAITSGDHSLRKQLLGHAANMATGGTNLQ